MKNDKPSSTAGRAAGLRDIGVLIPPPARPITQPPLKYQTTGAKAMPIRFLRGSRRRRPGKGGAAALANSAASCQVSSSGICNGPFDAPLLSRAV